MIIAISGPIGVGKSTVARALAERLGTRVISAGEVFREMARRRGLTVLELNRLAETHPEVDRQVDQMQADLSRGGSCVVESRLAGWMVPADLKVWLRADAAVRAARVAQREGVPVEEAERDLRQREASEWQRYRSLYGIDITDLSIFHVVLDSGSWAAEDIAEVLELLAARLQRSERPVGIPGAGEDRR